MKRFTETKKWSDPWFRRLDPKFKALWLYLVDSCDVAGVWDADLELASIHVGAVFEEQEIRSIFKERIDYLTNGKWYLNKFVEFQYGALNPDNNCHKAVIRALEYNKILGPNKPLNRPSQGPKDKDKDKDKDKGECEGERFPDNLRSPEFLAVWKRWKNHRVQIKHPLRPEMEISSLKKLSQYGQKRAIEIIEYTLVKGWQGLADEDKIPIVVEKVVKKAIPIIKFSQAVEDIRWMLERNPSFSPEEKKIAKGFISKLTNEEIGMLSEEEQQRIKEIQDS